MAFCCCCQVWGDAPLCSQCAGELRPGRRVLLASGVSAVAAFVHSGAARRMVHLLKYEGIEAPAAVLAREMRLLLPIGVTALVPIPRATARKVRYGSDPALSLARLLGASTGLPVVRSLAAPLWWPAHAGTARAKRTHPRFRNLGTAPIGSVLVDDVLTTGATVSAAAAISGIRHAITATRAGLSHGM